MLTGGLRARDHRNKILPTYPFSRHQPPDVLHPKIIQVWTKIIPPSISTYWSLCVRFIKITEGKDLFDDVSENVGRHEKHDEGSSKTIQLLTWLPLLNFPTRYLYLFSSPLLFRPYLKLFIGFLPLKQKFCVNFEFMQFGTPNLSRIFFQATTNLILSFTVFVNHSSNLEPLLRILSNIPETNIYVFISGIKNIWLSTRLLLFYWLYLLIYPSPKN